MPSLSPGLEPPAPSSFAQILPGLPIESLQAATNFTFRWKRYIVYASGRQLNILRSATELVQAITFERKIVAAKAEENIDVTAQNGKIAVTDGEDVWILEPWTDRWNGVSWRRALTLKREDAADEARTLCWGNDGELLVGGSRQLSLFNTLPSSRNNTPASSPVDPSLQRVEERQTLWSKPVSSPLLFTAFNPSASLIATCGLRDRLVKIWRRLSFEEGLFDHAYLPHPGLVTHLEWRSPDLSKSDDDDDDMETRRISTLSLSSRHEEDPEVLYTFCTDGVLRIWKSGSHNDLDILALHNTIDLVSAIPHSPLLPTTNGNQPSPKPSRYAFVLPAGVVVPALNSAISKRSFSTQQSGKAQHSHALEHLKEVCSKHPDAIITLDGNGRMSAWGVQSIGHKRRPDTPGSAGQAFHIAHAEDLPIQISDATHARFETWFDSDEMNLLVHHLGGRVEWWRGGIEAFFSLAAVGSDRVKLVAEWAGNDSQVQFDKSLEDSDVSSTVSALENLLAASDLVNPSLLETTFDFAAVVTADDARLVVLNLQDGYVEHAETLPRKIQQMRFLSRPAVQSSGNSGVLLALSYAESVDVLAQSRYDAASSSGEKCWHHVKRISIADLGLTIEALTWTETAQLAVAAGNTVFINDTRVSAHEIDGELADRLGLVENESTSTSELAHALNQPLPVWHPQSLQQLVWHGHFGAALAIWVRLEKTLKFFSEGDVLDATLGAEPDILLAEMAQTDDSNLASDTAHSLMSQFDELKIPGLSQADQTQLRFLLEATLFVQEHAGSLDENGLRFLFSWKIQVLELENAASRSQQSGKTKLANGDKPSPPAVPSMAWRDIVFAYHSTTQQPLLEILSAHYDNKFDWATVRALGIPAWLQAINAAQSEGSSLASLEQLFDSLAQSAYRSTYPPDPTKASLYFLALGKKTTLLALWRVAVGNREQRSTMQFLRRDFAAEENKTAARKNAYALMGKRRFEYAAAFFLLADDAASAIRILAGQCEDLPLAIAVARLYCGDGSKVLCDFVEERVIPGAMKLGSRWMASWAFSLLGNESDAAKAPVAPFDELTEGMEAVPRNWQQDDPATLLLYRYLRATTMKPGKGRVSLRAEKYEMQAVLRSARLLRRMGLWLLALELVRTWTFAAPVKSEVIEDASDAEETNVVQEVTNAEPKSILDNFSTPASHTTQAPKSMLDGFDTPLPKCAAQPARSMLDDFEVPASKTVQQAHKNMLDDSTSTFPSPAAPAEPSAADARAAKAAELLAKLKAKKEAAAKEGEKGKEKKAPTQFKEPEASSILDSFGF